MKLLVFIITNEYNRITKEAHQNGKCSQREFSDGPRPQAEHGGGLRRDGAFDDDSLHDFCKESVAQHRIPFEVSADPFYSESNINHLRQIVHDIDTSKAKLTEHELIEVD